MALDQASPLRKLASLGRTGKTPSPPLRTFTVTSGKGGVGKTNLVVNLSPGADPAQAAGAFDRRGPGPGQCGCDPGS